MGGKHEIWRLQNLVPEFWNVIECDPSHYCHPRHSVSRLESQWGFLRGGGRAEARVPLLLAQVKKVPAASMTIGKSPVYEEGHDVATIRTKSVPSDLKPWGSLLL